MQKNEAVVVGELGKITNIGPVLELVAWISVSSGLE